MATFVEYFCKSAHAVQREGMVDRVTPNGIEVRITRPSACGGCDLSARCNASESRDMLVSVPAGGMTYNVGDRVMVVTSSSSVKKALLLGFTVPLLLMLVTIVFSRFVFATGEIMAAFYGLLVLIPYYIMLYLCRNIVGRSVDISVEKYE